MNSDLTFVRVQKYIFFCKATVCIYTELKISSDIDRDIIMKNDHFLSAYCWVILVISIYLISLLKWLGNLHVHPQFIVFSLNALILYILLSFFLNFLILNCNILWAPSLNCRAVLHCITISLTYSVNETEEWY